MSANTDDDPTPSGWVAYLQPFSGLAQVVAIVVGVVISILSFNNTRRSEIETRNNEIKRLKVEAAKPFLQIREARYLEALKIATKLALSNGKDAAAKRRFEELYYGELAMVEGADTEKAMRGLAESLGIPLCHTPQLQATRKLASVVGRSLLISWQVDEQFVGENPSPCPATVEVMNIPGTLGPKTESRTVTRPEGSSDKIGQGYSTDTTTGGNYTPGNYTSGNSRPGNYTTGNYGGRPTNENANR